MFKRIVCLSKIMVTLVSFGEVITYLGASNGPGRSAKQFSRRDSKQSVGLAGIPLMRRFVN